MADGSLYSVRMRASKRGLNQLERLHVSGAENLVLADEIHEIVKSMVSRAMIHKNGVPDSINIDIELISTDINKVKKTYALPLTTIFLKNQEESMEFSLKVLKVAGIGNEIAERAFSLLTAGVSPDKKNMCGAIIMDAVTGERYEFDKYRGVRVSKVDMTEGAENEFKKKLKILNLDQYSGKIGEALVSATKVIQTKGTIAEVCWPDEPVYTLGYIASQKIGYVRIPNMKPMGLEKGGRIIFVENINIEEYINNLEEVPILIDGVTDVNPLISPAEFLRSLLYFPTF